jgi:hypothetical protein
MSEYKGVFSGPIARHGKTWWSKPFAGMLNMIGLGHENIQAVLFPKDYGAKAAKAYLKQHDLKPIKRAHKTAGRIRYRIADPVKGAKYITKSVDDGIQFIIKMGEQSGGLSVSDVLPPPRVGPSPQVQQIIEREGGSMVKNITVYRAPLAGPIQKAVDILRRTTLRPPDPVYDKLFHLYMIVGLDNGREYLVERNETFQARLASGSDKQGKGIESMPVNLQGRPINFSQLLVRPAEVQGPSFWRYDAFKNNCQDMILRTLSTFGLLTPELRGFIKQDVEDLLPRFVQGLVNGATNKITDLAARFRRWIGQGVESRVGQRGGMNDDDCCPVMEGGKFGPGVSVDKVPENVIKESDDPQTKADKTLAQIMNTTSGTKKTWQEWKNMKKKNIVEATIDGVTRAGDLWSSGQNPILNVAKKVPVLGAVGDLVAARSTGDAAKAIGRLGADVTVPGVSSALSYLGKGQSGGIIAGDEKYRVGYDRDNRRDLFDRLSTDKSRVLSNIRSVGTGPEDVVVHVGGQAFKLQPIEPQRVFY